MNKFTKDILEKGTQVFIGEVEYMQAHNARPIKLDATGKIFKPTGTLVRVKK